MKNTWKGGTHREAGWGQLCGDPVLNDSQGNIGVPYLLLKQGILGVGRSLRFKQHLLFFFKEPISTLLPFQLSSSHIPLFFSEKEATLLGTVPGSGTPRQFWGCWNMTDLCLHALPRNANSSGCRGKESKEDPFRGPPERFNSTKADELPYNGA